MGNRGGSNPRPSESSTAADYNHIFQQTKKPFNISVKRLFLIRVIEGARTPDPQNHSPRRTITT